MSVGGRVAVVTGGNSGIGQAICLGLARAGAKVVIDYVAHPEAAEGLVKQIAASGGEAVSVEADVSRVDGVEALVAAAVARFGRLDIMVNNAWIETRKSVLEATEAEFDKTLAVNLKGAFFGTQLAARQMIAQGSGGVVVNISSVHEDWPMPGNIAYCVSKGGMRMLTRTAGVELAPHKIRVVGIGPGAVGTPMNLVLMQQPGLLSKLTGAIPLGRLATPEEIAKVVVFAAGDDASYLTATTIFADGGIMQSSVGL